ncbi:glutamine amidotransferase [Acinetobacter sp. WZC-1]|uniref:glutamine amidotransferase n=1 Tax=Acinetobacter sp. WZC-1 TaxID=3459034 RepID=UPI00403DAD53
MDSSFPKSIYAIQHLAFEDLGSLEDIFYQLGYRVRYFEAGVDDLTPALQYEGLTIILGGPIGVYETEDYPFLKDELHHLKQRLDKKRPTLGICLGAQLIAQALGARVYAGHVKEIGWSPLEIRYATDNMLAPLENTPVLHWHGDTFDLPRDAELLASSSVYSNQAFRVGQHILAMQFHLEVTAEHMEKWLIGHSCELRKANINIPALRQDSQLHAQALQTRAELIIKAFLAQIATL